MSNNKKAANGSTLNGNNNKHDKDNNFLPELPAGTLTEDELQNDIAQRTNGKQQKPQGSPRGDKEGFPLDILPPKLEELIKGAKTALGIPPDFLGASCLLAAAVAAGNTHQLQIKEAFTQRPIFYLVLIGNPNCNKSGALKFAMKPITNRDGDSYDEYQAQQAEYEVIKGMGKKERQEEGITEMPAPPIYSRSLVSDITPEALASVHQDNPRGIAVFRDELAGWVKDFNRYNQGGEQEMWLSAWNGDALVIDRKTAGPVRIKNSFICVAGTIQPAVVEELANGGRAMNGFIDRMLFVWPEGLEKPKWTDDEINLELLGEYQGAITRLLDLTFDEENKAHTLTLKSGAKERLFHFYNDENKPLCDEAENELLAGIYGKFDLHTARLVIALHLLWWTYQDKGRRPPQPPQQVEERTVEQAIKAAKYFRSQALKVYNRLHNESPVERLPADKREVYEALPEEFKKADGLAIAEGKGMHPKTFSRLLTDKKLFEKVKHGEYSKIY